MNRAIIYLRISTLAQEQSIDAQEVELRDYCDLLGFSVIDVIADSGVSGLCPIGDRPGGARLLARISNDEADTVVAWRLDRLFRSALNALMIVESWALKGVSLHLKDLGGVAVDTNSAIGKVFLAMMAAFAQLERDQTSERVKMVMARKREQHEYLGGRIPYGTRISIDGRTLEPELSELEAIRLAKDWRMIDGLSLRQIGIRLIENGYPPRSSATWQPSSIKAILEKST